MAAGDPSDGRARSGKPLPANRSGRPIIRADGSRRVKMAASGRFRDVAVNSFGVFELSKSGGEMVLAAERWCSSPSSTEPPY